MFSKGMIHVYYGNGQGKTCAAVGLAARACGNDCKVLFAQFLKNGRSGEVAALERLAGGVEVLECRPCGKFFFDMDERERAQAAAEQHEAFLRMKEKVHSGSYGLLVLDEALDAVKHGIISADELLGFLRNRPEYLEVVLTGHEVFPELLELADYVSEVRKVKHPYDMGIGARKGVEW